MAKKVLKFGGTSVGTTERIQHVAKIVKKEQLEGNEVIVIVSAMAGKTNELVKLSNEISLEFNKRELDVLLSSGEQVTCALLAGALLKLNIKARSFLNWQIPILTEGDHSNSRIINISSIAGKEGNPNAVAYSSAKAAVIALTKSLGKELSDYDISVNCVTPSAGRTRIFDQMTDEHIQYMLSKIPRNRFIKHEEVSSLVAWLASEECSYSTGAVFDLSGGRATY